MKRLKHISLTIALLFSCTSVLATTTVWDVENGTPLEYNAWIEELPLKAVFVLGEQHSQEKIQIAQADFIKSFLDIQRPQNEVTIAWEFLNFADQENILDLTELYRNEEIEMQELTQELFPDVSDHSYYQPYQHVLEILSRSNVNLLGVNAPRRIKTRLRNDGMDSLEPQWRVPNMRLGTDNYLERFRTAMGGHGSEEQIQSFFLAQSYTDCYIAHSLFNFHPKETKFLLVGNFHSKYNDGAVKEIAEYGDLPTVNIHIVDAKGLTSEERQNFKLPHPIYGVISNYIIFLD
jgi:uncharacterized iron-regulated protein